MTSNLFEINQLSYRELNQYHKITGQDIIIEHGFVKDTNIELNYEQLSLKYFFNAINSEIENLC